MSDQGGGASRSTDPASGTSSATDVSLREYLTALINAAEKRSDARFEAMKNAVDAAFESSEKAILKAEDADKTRFESFNEFNQRIDTILSNTVTKQTMDVLIEKLESQINRNREDLDALSKRVDVRQGELQGSKITIGNLVLMITVGVAVIGLLVVLANYFAGR
jgi:hypothetical protein